MINDKIFILGWSNPLSSFGKEMCLTSGVAQGSMLSPLSFYIRNITESIHTGIDWHREHQDSSLWVGQAETRLSKPDFNINDLN